MPISAKDITIAITVYDRRDYILNAVRSALTQSVPVSVMVVEDCGPDPTLRDLVTKEFGSRIRYIRNFRNRGLFDNWNACVENCETPWISILHDDDLLRPNFVETMIEVSRAAPGRVLYQSEAAVIDEKGEFVSLPPVNWKGDWRDIDLVEFADHDFIMYFVGNLFLVEAAKKIGGFRANSFYTGDWDFWFRMAVDGGAAETASVVADIRDHSGPERGSNRVDRMGWRWALENAQRKRNIALLSTKKGIHIKFDRSKHLKKRPMPSRVIMQNAKNYSRRILKYNTWLFTHSQPPHLRYAMLQWLVRLLGPTPLRWA